jgi:hypothetical protein
VSKEALLVVAVATGGIPYIPFKMNSQSEGPEQWQKLWHLFWFRRWEFEQHYHLWSNVELTFGMYDQAKVWQFG